MTDTPTPSPIDRDASQAAMQAQLDALAADVRRQSSGGGWSTALLVALALVAGGAAAGLFGLGRQQALRNRLAQSERSRARALAEAELAVQRAAEARRGLISARERADDLAGERARLERRLVSELTRAETWAREREHELQQQLVKVRAELAARERELAARQEPPSEGDGAQIGDAPARAKGASDFATTARRYQKGLYLIVLRTERDGLIALGTAFAVRADGLLATNAHVLADAERRRADLAQAGVRAELIAVRNKSDARDALRVIERRPHPEYDPRRARSKDCALVRVDTGGSPLPVVLPLATRAELLELAEGHTICLLGFPGEVSDPRQPIATFKRGDIGRLTTLDGARGPRVSELLVQHSATATGGNSGSPLIDGSGRVVALHTSGLSTRVKTGSREIVLRPSTGIHWALRADVLWDLLLDTLD